VTSGRQPAVVKLSGVPQALDRAETVIGRLPEQVPYQECSQRLQEHAELQACHMPVVKEPVPITRVFGVPREGVSRHYIRRREFVHGCVMRTGIATRSPSPLCRRSSRPRRTGRSAFSRRRRRRISIEDVQMHPAAAGRTWSSRTWRTQAADGVSLPPSVASTSSWRDGTAGRCRVGRGHPDGSVTGE